LASINMKHMIVQAKIVYYGPGRGGKTTNLEYIYSRYQHQAKTEMVSIKTDGDRTLFFDFLPLEIGKIKGYDVKIQLYTVPGQVMYNATRKVVLKGVDGIVFVADSLEAKRDTNIESLQNLKENLTAQNVSLENIPIILQYNKRDLEKEGTSMLSYEALEEDLNSNLKAPSFMSSALMGENVIETLRKILAMTMVKLTDRMT